MKVPKISAMTLSTDGMWSGSSNTNNDHHLSSLQDAFDKIKKWMDDPEEIAWRVIDADNLVIYLSDIKYKDRVVKSAKTNFNVDISDVRVGFPK